MKIIISLSLFIIFNTAKAQDKNKFFSNNKDVYFAALLCIYAQNPTGNFSEWQHEIFNMTIFDVSSYSAQLSNFLNNYHDWNAESNECKNKMQQLFGNDWKRKVSAFIAFEGLENSGGIVIFMNNMNYYQPSNYQGNDYYEDKFLELLNMIYSKDTNANLTDDPKYNCN